MEDNANSVGIGTKVCFLRQPSSYPDPTHSVEAVETHMSWVFLTDNLAYKLKKPVRFEFLDFSTLAARRADCCDEVRLNRRLAPDVYLGIVPITLRADRTLAINGAGEPVEWLVKMRKLSRDDMLDCRLTRGNVTDREIESVGHRLGDFFNRASSADISGAEYFVRLARAVRSIRFDLTQQSFGLPLSRIEWIASELSNLIQANRTRLIQRVRDEHVIEGHGDLRPEHICLESPPVIIDCLEFSRDLRLLDTASEMSFLSLECDRLGAKQISRDLWRIYRERTGDEVPEDLLRCYRALHAFSRARTAIAHLRDASVRDPGKWKPQAESYLTDAAKAVALQP